MSELPASFGVALSSARIRRGQSLDEVAKTTRIPRHALEALEADDLAGLPALVYARGFIRLYAQAVGLDPTVPIRLLDERLNERAAAEEHAQHEADERESTERWMKARVRVTYGVAVLFLGAVVAAALLSLSPQPLEARDLRDDAAVPAPPPPSE